MLVPRPWKHEAPYGKKKEIPQQARSWASFWSFPTILYIIDFHWDGGESIHMNMTVYLRYSTGGAPHCKVVDR